MPIEFPEEASGFGAWRTFVLAAGLADAVSRTVTAPIDRLKTQLQVMQTWVNFFCFLSCYVLTFFVNMTLVGQVLICNQFHRIHEKKALLSMG